MGSGTLKQAAWLGRSRLNQAAGLESWRMLFDNRIREEASGGVCVFANVGQVRKRVRYLTKVQFERASENLVRNDATECVEGA